MKVVQQPKNSPEWSREFTCNSTNMLKAGCGAVVLVERADLELDFDIDSQHDIVVAACCVCGTQIVVEDPKRGDWGDLRPKRDDDSRDL